ncbi:MAG: hypothetical protein LBQ77_05220 [Treponema sp.]|nr:hypothetical protein [Treponema sp.]
MRSVPSGDRYSGGQTFLKIDILGDRPLRGISSFWGRLFGDRPLSGTDILGDRLLGNRAFGNRPLGDRPPQRSR